MRDDFAIVSGLSGIRRQAAGQVHNCSAISGNFPEITDGCELFPSQRIKLPDRKRTYS
jgi:hypothetical protein